MLICSTPTVAVEYASRAPSQIELESMHLQPDEVLEYELETDTYVHVKRPPERSLTYFNSLEI